MLRIVSVICPIDFVLSATLSKIESNKLIYISHSPNDL